MSKLGVHAVPSDNPAMLGLPSLHDEYWEPFWRPAPTSTSSSAATSAAGLSAARV